MVSKNIIAETVGVIGHLEKIFFTAKKKRKRFLKFTMNDQALED